MLSTRLASLRRMQFLRSWEAILFVLFLITLFYNSARAPAYLTVENQINVFYLYAEKIIVALIMTFIIINGEIDLSVSSVMGLAAGVLGRLIELGYPGELALAAALVTGLLCGLWNGLWIAYGRLSSLIVTLAGMIMFRGLVWVLVEDRSITTFPDWINNMGQRPILGPFPLSLLIFFFLLIIAYIVLQHSAFGRYVYVIGNNREVARFSGVKVETVKLVLFIASGLISALAGVLYTARLGAMRASTAEGFELEIITMVLLGGVNIFGGSGTLLGVLLSILLILNLRNGMSLSNITLQQQTGVIGALLIFSVLVPNLATRVRAELNRRRFARLAAERAALAERKEVKAETK
jgi:rhamnose transport system permease protein